MKCDECKREAVTKDGRNLCLHCLRRAVAAATPMVGCFVGRSRGDDHRQARDLDDSPWQANAVRALEDLTSDP